MLATRNPYLYDEYLLKHEYVLPVFPPITRNPDIEKVIFNNPATIVIWKDKTKTVVKCQEGDTYSPELGLAMCISKKYLGNKGNFNEVFKKWIPEDVPVKSGLFAEIKIDGETLGKAVSNAMCNLGKSLVRDYGPETDIPEVGTRIKIINTKNGCTGAIGKIGIVTSDPHNCGLLGYKPGYNVDVLDGEIWRINPDAKIEIIK